MYNYIYVYTSRQLNALALSLYLSKPKVAYNMIFYSSFFLHLPKILANGPFYIYIYIICAFKIIFETDSWLSIP